MFDPDQAAELTATTDAIVKVTRTTICGIGLHILKGDVPTCEPDRILGHEGVGVVHQTGDAVSGLAALLTPQFYLPAQIIMIDLDANRLEVAQRFGATACIDNAHADAVAQVLKLMKSVGADCVIEAVSSPATFELCQQLVASAIFTWTSCGDRNIAITTPLVDTVSTPMLMKTVKEGRIEPTLLITHRFRLDDILSAYETFSSAASTRALKVLIEAS
ncbi:MULTISPECIES: zinc-binding dehydrogenase [Paraburkholderia]|uniref:Zinc-binding dehydrogenase n=1 Tax=Paraburkholderia podalyriae TaxID=1938811 RepID=A0ABR7PPU4_9BURK|nr:zinc-binding dehydrogenase [Paraburkholderia podalyriae]MBC8748263.1 zinc-binding dehydrogenase [Paraburkholderia podalyriae]